MAAKYDPRTAKGWPLPYRRNCLEDDVGRITETFIAICDDIIDLQNDIKELKSKLAEIARSPAQSKKSEVSAKIEGQLDG